MASEHATTLTTGDVAELIGIHPSTVKRWFGGGRRSATTGKRGVSATSGGHRRISLEVALHVARERGHPVYLHGFGLDAESVWHAVRALDAGDSGPVQQMLINWLKAGRTRPIGRFLRHVTGLGGADGFAGHGPRPANPRILDGVFGGFMEQVGEGWARGELPIRAERAASREVSETIYALLDRAGRTREPGYVADTAARGGRAAAAGLDRAGGARAPTRPTAVVATVEPDQHVLGSLLVRLMLVQRGWRVEHLGTGLPVAEIVAAQKAAGASLVCVSFTPPRGSADVRRFVDVAGRLADPCSPYSLALGGGGARGVDLCGCGWPFGAPAALDSLAEFSRWLDRHADLPTPASPVRPRVPWVNPVAPSAGSTPGA